MGWKGLSISILENPTVIRRPCLGNRCEYSHKLPPIFRWTISAMLSYSAVKLFSMYCRPIPTYVITVSERHRQTGGQATYCALRSIAR